MRSVAAMTAFCRSACLVIENRHGMHGALMWHAALVAAQSPRRDMRTFDPVHLSPAETAKLVELTESGGAMRTSHGTSLTEPTGNQQSMLAAYSKEEKAANLPVQEPYQVRIDHQASDGRGRWDSRFRNQYCCGPTSSPNNGPSCAAA